MANLVSRGRFVWHELLAKDTKAAQKFYTQVIGWDTSRWSGPADSQHDYTMWMVGDRPVGGVMGYPPEAVQAGAPPSWTAYVEVPDTDATVILATSLGASVILEPTSVESVGRFAILKDPQGAVFAVIKSENAPGAEMDPKPLEFSWHELTTIDYKAADKFYTALFGWETKSDYDMGEMGVYHMFGRDRFTYGGMFNRSKKWPGNPHWLHYVLVDNADAAADRATKAGGKIVNGPTDVPGGDRIASLVDPEGAVFAVTSKGKK